MALLPSLTTSKRVTGSPPSPLCWATPLAFPRPLATPTALSVGDFRGFLLDVCGCGDVMRQEGNKAPKHSFIQEAEICSQVHTNTDVHTLRVIGASSWGFTHLFQHTHPSTHSYNQKQSHAHKVCLLTRIYTNFHGHRLVPGVVFQASLSSSCLSALDRPSHSCSYLSPLHLLPQTHWMSP